MIHYTFISNILQHILFFNNRIFIKRIAPKASTILKLY